MCVVVAVGARVRDELLGNGGGGCVVSARIFGYRGKYHAIVGAAAGNGCEVRGVGR